MKYMKLYEDVSTIYQIDKAIKICDDLDKEIDILLDSQKIKELKLLLEQIAMGGAVNPNLKYLSENSMKHLIDILQQLGRMLTSLIKCITENISFSTTRKNGSSSQVNQRPTPSAQRLSKSYQRPAPSDFQNNTSAQRPATENKQQAYE